MTSRRYYLLDDFGSATIIDWCHPRPGR